MKSLKPKHGKIKTRLTHANTVDRQLGGVLQGEHTYLWIGSDGKCAGYLSGRPLYRLARAIVKQWEG